MGERILVTSGVKMNARTFLGEVRKCPHFRDVVIEGFHSIDVRRCINYVKVFLVASIF